MPRTSTSTSYSESVARDDVGLIGLDKTEDGGQRDVDDWMVQIGEALYYLGLADGNDHTIMCHVGRRDDTPDLTQVVFVGHRGTLLRALDAMCVKVKTWGPSDLGEGYIRGQCRFEEY